MLKQKARTVALAVLVTDLALTAVSLPLTCQVEVDEVSGKAAEASLTNLVTAL